MFEEICIIPPNTKSVQVNQYINQYERIFEKTLNRFIKLDHI